MAVSTSLVRVAGKSTLIFASARTGLGRGERGYIFFLAQGSFGAGQGKFDPVIGFLGTPATFSYAILDFLVEGSLEGFLEWLPLPQFIKEHDLFVVIWFPALLNVLLFFLVGLAEELETSKTR